jgi:hypothetical protein
MIVIVFVFISQRNYPPVTTLCQQYIGILKFIYYSSPPHPITTQIIGKLATPLLQERGNGVFEKQVNDGVRWKMQTKRAYVSSN